MNILSLFDGISCGRIATERAGFKINNYYASEVDNNAIEVTQSNYPNTIQLGDINNIDLTKLPKIDLILAGSPCQGFSKAGKGLNFEDPRSKLFFKFIEILEYIKTNNNPDVKFLLENVVMKKEWSNVITEYIGVEPLEINSVLLIPQNRPRLYWTNIEGVDKPKDKQIKLKDILDNVDTTNYIDYKGLKVDNNISEDSLKLIDNVNGEIRISQATKQGYIIANEGDGINLSFPTSKTRRGRVTKEKSSCLDCSCDINVYINNSIRNFNINEIEKLQTLPIGYTNILEEPKRKKAIGNGWTVDIIVHILKHMNT